MENEQVIAPTPAAASPEPASLPLGEYRASLDPKPAKVDPKPAPAVAAAPPVEPGDPVVDDGEETDTPVERKKKLGGYQKTIARQAAEIAALRGTPAAAAAGASPAAPAAPAVAAAPTEPTYGVPMPKLEDCASLEEFTLKTANWTLDERDWKREQQTAVATRVAAATALTTNWNTTKATFVADHPDWDDAMASVADIRLSPDHQRILLESPNGVALAYELALNRSELERIAALSPLKAAVEIGILAAAHKAAAAEPAPEKEIKVSNAPPPFRPVAGNGAVVKPNPANMDLADYRKAVETGRIH